MSEKRFVAEQVDVVNEDQTEVWDVVFDTENTYAFMVRDTDTASDLCDLLNEQQATIKSKDKQLERLYNYFQDYLKDEMSGNAFSEMWDNVKEDERWNDD